MKRKSILLFFSVIMSFFAFGQDFNNYTPMKSSGKVPEDLRKTSYQKYVEDIKKLEYGGSNFEWEAKKKFLL